MSIPNLDTADPTKTIAREMEKTPVMDAPNSRPSKTNRKNPDNTPTLFTNNDDRNFFNITTYTTLNIWFVASCLIGIANYYCVTVSF
jgi:hypothetical protein